MVIYEQPGMMDALKSIRIPFLQKVRAGRAALPRSVLWSMLAICPNALLLPGRSLFRLQAQPKVVGRMRVMVADVAREGRIKDHWPLLEAQVRQPVQSDGGPRWPGGVTAAAPGRCVTVAPRPPARHSFRPSLLPADGRVPPVPGVEPRCAGQEQVEFAVGGTPGAARWPPLLTPARALKKKTLRSLFVLTLYSVVVCSCLAAHLLPARC